MGIESAGANSRHEQNEASRGQWAKVLLALTGGIITAYTRKGGEGDFLNKALHSAGETRRALENFDPDNDIAGKVEDYAIRGYQALKDRYRSEE